MINESTTPVRVAQHAAAFNAAVRSGDWNTFAGRFTAAAKMRFIGVPVGPFAGQAAIERAYAEQPPADTLSVRQVDSIGQVDVVRFAWGSGGGGMMRLTWQDHLVASLDVTFDAE